MLIWTSICLGKYRINNHVPILKSYAEYPLEVLYVPLWRIAMPHVINEAIQEKISQKGLNFLILEIPNPKDVKDFEDLSPCTDVMLREAKRLSSCAW